MFMDGDIILGNVALNSAGEAVLTLSGLRVGKRVITVEYSGDSNFLPVTGTAPLVHYRSPKPRGQP